jgi:hypothetical protein
MAIRPSINLLFDFSHILDILLFQITHLQEIHLQGNALQAPPQMILPLTSYITCKSPKECQQH